MHDKYHSQLAGANRELFAQFLIRIYNEIPNCLIANFSSLKNLSGAHFKKFRDNFRAKLERLFVCPADTFDNVNGQFSIGFSFCNTSKKEAFDHITADAFDKNGSFFDTKEIYSYHDSRYFSEWVNSFRLKSDLPIGWLEGTTRNSFQHNSIIFILNGEKQMVVPRGMPISSENLIRCCVCFAVRKVIPADWLNNRDQFLYPNDNWKTDKKFLSDCLAYTLFHGKNSIQTIHGVNHWIPFTEEEVNSRSKFESNFMTDYIAGRIERTNGGLFSNGRKKGKKLVFSPEAKAVFKAGKKLWTYYHAQPKCNVNASLYDIREYFQGRNANGKMNNKSTDEIYNTLIADLRSALKVLAEKITPKVYEYGFLKE
jgi:hypothetical protein